jgi:chromosome segregation ATPase
MSDQRRAEMAEALRQMTARVAELEAEVQEHQQHVATVMQREAALKAENATLHKQVDAMWQAAGDFRVAYEAIKEDNTDLEATVDVMDNNGAELEAERDALKEQIATLQADARLGALVRAGVRAYHRLQLMRMARDDVYGATVTLRKINEHGHHIARHCRDITVDAALAAVLGEETP